MGKVLEAAPAAFGEAAGTYDADFEPHASHLRLVMIDAMLRTFRPGDRLLDINCGTGTDAIALAARGFRVTAVDGSAPMIDALRRKLALRPAAASSVESLVMPFEDLGRLPAGSFDGVLSNFGGLNCTEDLPGVLRGIAGLLRTGGAFVACVLNRVALWEIAAFAARLDLRRALRRMVRGGTAANVGTHQVMVRYYSPREFARLMHPSFTVEQIFGLSILSPPPASARFSTRHPRLVRRLSGFDDAVRRLPPFASLGDHFAVIGRRR